MILPVPGKKTAGSCARLILLCWMAYTSAYLGRLNFSACTVRIIESFQTTKAEIGLVASFFFFAYGAGQLINGVLCRRYRPRFAIAAALIFSSLLNLGITVVKNLAVMRILWMCNGFAQSVLWSTLIHTLSMRLPDQDLKKAVVVMSTTIALGTALAYGISALSVFLADWQWAFYAGALCMTLCAVIWVIFLPRDPERDFSDPDSEPEERKIPLALLGEIVLMMLLCVVDNFLKDGLTFWTPNILTESYHLDQALSIVLTLTLPLVAVSGTFFSVRLSRILPHPVTLTGAFLLISLLALGALRFFLRLGAPWPVILIGFILVVCAASAINQIFTSMVPLEYRGRIHSGLLAGLADAFCYVGSTLSSSLIGKTADSIAGWSGVFALLFRVCALGTAACAAFTVFYRRKKRRS